jgi:acyl-CoA reductase-like NAD-dependent aldehyde dehydrogenase
MTIAAYPPTQAGQTDAFAVADPKNISFDGNQFVVKTGAAYDAGPAPTADEVDRAAARAHVKLTALKAMTPAQIQTWVAANVTTLAQAQDAIATLAIAVGILSRSL